MKCRKYHFSKTFQKLSIQISLIEIFILIEYNSENFTATSGMQQKKSKIFKIKMLTAYISPIRMRIKSSKINLFKDEMKLENISHTFQTFVE